MTKTTKKQPEALPLVYWVSLHPFNRDNWIVLSCVSQGKKILAVESHGDILPKDLACRGPLNQVIIRQLINRFLPDPKDYPEPKVSPPEDDYVHWISLHPLTRDRWVVLSAITQGNTILIEGTHGDQLPQNLAVIPFKHVRDRELIDRNFSLLQDLKNETSESA